MLMLNKSHTDANIRKVIQNPDPIWENHILILCIIDKYILWMLTGMHDTEWTF